LEEVKVLINRLSTQLRIKCSKKTVNWKVSTKMPYKLFTSKNLSVFKNLISKNQ